MKNEETVIRVGIADMKIAKAPERIRTSGLGSCVGIALYDAHAKTAGLAHIMLPDSSLAKGQQPVNAAKFADTALPALVADLERQGAKQRNMRAKIAGGAQMFKFTQGGSEQMRIGPRNVQAVKEMLETLRIQIVAEDVGGSSGRTIEFDPDTCQLEIRTVNLGTTVI